MTVIGFVGSVFSPYYAWNRRRGAANPLNHCAFNVALYGPRAGRWAMTERGAGQLERDASVLAIGPSHLRWCGDALEIHIDEICAPVPRRIRGTVRLLPYSTCNRAYALDTAGRHRWMPVAPCAAIEASFSAPDLSWSGVGYADSNRGDEPLEDAFSYWTWSRSGARSRAGGPSSVVLYDVRTRDRSDRTLALKFAANGSIQSMEPPPPVALPGTGWRVSRSTRADAGTEARVIDTLEDAPFYSRSLLDTQLAGERAPAIHESLNLDRFRSYWVQSLLPFRMPRITRGSRPDLRSSRS